MTKVPSARDPLGESPEKASDRVCRLCLVQGNLFFIGYGSQVRFERNKIVIKEHHIGDSKIVVVEIKYFCTKSVVIHTENCKLNLALDCSTTQMENWIYEECVA